MARIREWFAGLVREILGPMLLDHGRLLRDLRAEIELLGRVRADLQVQAERRVTPEVVKVEVPAAPDLSPILAELGAVRALVKAIPPPGSPSFLERAKAVFTPPAVQQQATGQLHSTMNGKRF